MSLRVVTVVISNDQPNFLNSCLRAVEKQTFQSDRVLVVDTSDDDEVKKVLEDFTKRSSKHAVVFIDEQANFAELAATGIKQVLTGYENIDEIAIWLLHDDSIPEAHALAELARTLELSPLVGIAASKQVAVDNAKLIVQQGLTLTKSYRPFSLVNDEFDQKQHDSMSDVLAVSTNSMLVRANLWADLGGFSLAAPYLAQDIEFGIRAHHAGYRVVVVPTSRVAHAELSIHNKRSRRWLKGSSKLALARATNHLRISQLPIVFAFLYWLSLPLYSVFQVFWLMLVKRPDRIWLSLRANFWAFFTVRARVRDRHGFSAKTLGALFASAEAVRTRSRLALELAEQKSNLTSFDSAADSKSVLSFASGGGLWVMLGLVAISINYFPIGQAVIGGFTLPLSDSWLQLFANTGASYQHIGLGLAAPSDPFNWVLLIIGSLTFWSPNLALSYLLLLAKAIAFFGAWRAISLATQRNSLRIVLALLYVFWPSFNLAQSQGNYPAVVFFIVLPWLLFCLSRSTRVGISSSVRSTEQGWSWIAAAAILLMVATAAAPNSLLVLLVIFVCFLFFMRKRLVTALLVGLPTLVICTPYFLFHVLTLRNPLGVLADPTISFSTGQPDFVTSILGQDKSLGWFVLGFIGLALLSLLSRQSPIFGLWLLALVAAANILLVSNLKFTSGGIGSIFLKQADWVYDSPAPSAMMVSLCLLLAIAIWLDALLRVGFRRIWLTTIFVAVVCPLIYGFASQPTLISFGESRNLPAIFTASAQSDHQYRMLVISSSDNGDSQSFRAEIINPTGIKLDKISTAYRLSPANTSADYPGKQELATLVANLVSANGKSLAKSLEQSEIGYVLVPKSSANGEIQIALNTAAELDQVGITEFGQLWRVKLANEATSAGGDLWSVTKGIQSAVLVGFILLALPTARGRKQRVSNELAEPEPEQ